MPILATTKNIVYKLHCILFETILTIFINLAWYLLGYSLSLLNPSNNFHNIQVCIIHQPFNFNFNSEKDR